MARYTEEQQLAAYTKAKEVLAAIQGHDNFLLNHVVLLNHKSGNNNPNNIPTPLVDSLSTYPDPHDPLGMEPYSVVAGYPRYLRGVDNGANISELIERAMLNEQALYFSFDISNNTASEYEQIFATTYYVRNEVRKYLYNDPETAVGTWTAFPQQNPGKVGVLLDMAHPDAHLDSFGYMVAKMAENIDILDLSYDQDIKYDIAQHSYNTSIKDLIDCVLDIIITDLDLVRATDDALVSAITASCRSELGISPTNHFAEDCVNYIYDHAPMESPCLMGITQLQEDNRHRTYVPDEVIANTLLIDLFEVPGFERMITEKVESICAHVLEPYRATDNTSN